MLRAVLSWSWIVTSLLAQQVAEGPEPNQTPATATVLACGREGVGSISTSLDVDWWKITVVAGSEILVETMPGAGTQIGDTVVTLFDSSGAPLRTNDDGVGCGRYSRLRLADLAAGTYYVAVERGAFAALSGSYVLDVRCAVPATLGAPLIVNEGAENNDPRSGGTPTTIVPDVRVNGLLSSTGSTGDHDFYRFTLAQASFVRASVAATASHPTPPVADDLVLALYDNTVPPAVLASSFTGNGFGAFDASIGIWLAPGTYQVAVRGWRGSIAGRYYLDVRTTVGATASANANGCAGRALDVARTNSGPGAPLGLERPVLGRTYALQGSGLGGSSIGIHLFGVTPASLDLGPFGAAGCTLALSWIDLLAFITDAAGNAAVVLALGEDPSLLGVPLETQVAMLDGSNALGMTFSNSVSAVIGN